MSNIRIGRPLVLTCECFIMLDHKDLQKAGEVYLWTRALMASCITAYASLWSSFVPLISLQEKYRDRPSNVVTDNMALLVHIMKLLELGTNVLLEFQTYDNRHTLPTFSSFHHARRNPNSLLRQCETDPYDGLTFPINSHTIFFIFK